MAGDDRYRHALPQPVASHAQLPHPVASHAPTPPPLQPLPIGRAERIGPPQVGTRYDPDYQEILASDNPLRALAAAILGGERPPSVQAKDPYGIHAAEIGAGPWPVMAGPVKDIAGPQKVVGEMAEEAISGLKRVGGGKTSAAVRAVLSDEAKEAHLARAPVEYVGDRLLVSPRMLGGKGKNFRPAEPGRILTPTIEAASADPSYLKRLADSVRSSPMLRSREARYNDLGVLDAFADRGAENIDALIEMQPKTLQRRAGKWYPGGQGIGDEVALEGGTNVNHNQGVAVLARLSPGTEWPMNIDNAKRIARWWKTFNQTDQDFTREHFNHFVNSMQLSAADWIKKNNLTGDKLARYQAGIAKRVATTYSHIGHPWSALPHEQRAQLIRAHSEMSESQHYPIYAPEGHIVMPKALTLEGEPMAVKWQSYENLARALKILDDPSDANISFQLGRGHKVRSFHNDMSVPSDPRSVTVDVHKVAGSHYRPLGGSSAEVLAVTGGTPEHAPSGTLGPYPLYQEASTRAASARSMVPNQAQSIGWEGAKGLFPPYMRKNAEDPQSFGAAAKAIWEEFQRGRISIHEAQARVHDLAGGFRPPEWAGYPETPPE